MNDRIFIDDIEIFASHGVFAGERCRLQRFLLTICAELDAATAKVSDEISHTVDYIHLLNTAVEAVKNSSFHLIERLAQHVADSVFSKFNRITALSVTIKKFPSELPENNFSAIGFSSTFLRDEK
ncbi:MAG: dihydroneopterin aldolase [Puniceicoccales bacterium]|jgi:dihydroneopterin aldolase|nr:dihydroneopterin aldolase [Puniceicoccales bacterium]